MVPRDEHAAAFRKCLVFKVNGGDAGRFELTHGADDIDGSAEPGVRECSVPDALAAYAGV